MTLDLDWGERLVHSAPIGPFGVSDSSVPEYVYILTAVRENN